MKDFKLTIGSLGYFIQEITKMITDNPNKAFRVNVVGWRDKRSISQNSFQHAIYTELSKYLISKGRTDWTPGKTKFEMKNNFLGWREIECLNVKTGEMTIKEVLIATRSLDVGESFDYTTRILDFCQSIGCFIKIPENSDYLYLQTKQNK